MTVCVCSCVCVSLTRFRLITCNVLLSHVCSLALTVESLTILIQWPWRCLYLLLLRCWMPSTGKAFGCRLLYARQGHLGCVCRCEWVVMLLCFQMYFFLFRCPDVSQRFLSTFIYIGFFFSFIWSIDHRLWYHLTYSCCHVSYDVPPCLSVILSLHYSLFLCT